MNPEEIQIIECKKAIEGYAISEDISIFDVTTDLENIGATVYSLERRMTEQYGEIVEFSALIHYDIEVHQNASLDQIAEKCEEELQNILKQTQIVFITNI